MTTRHITIGPEFFAKAKNDYNNWQWAIVREFMQNSIDCGSKNINIEITRLGEDTSVVVTNDGNPMDEETLTGKLLSLGSSGKEDRTAGSVGGFGKAKEILYFCHKRYMIESGDMLVQGSGSRYTLEHEHAHLHGTRSSVVIEGDEVDELCLMVNKFARMTQWSGTLTINNVEVKCDLNKGFRRKETSFGVVYTNRSFRNRMIVRIGGIPMFYDYISYEGCVLVELSKDSLVSLTSNRDSLKGEDRNNLMSFVSELAADKDSAFRDKTPVYNHYPGSKFRVSATVKPSKGMKVSTPTAGVDMGSPSGSFSPAEVPTDAYATAAKLAMAASEAEVSNDGFEFDFVVKNDTGMDLPEYYLPENISTYADKLLKIWVNVLVKMHDVLGLSDDYSVGFVFSEDAEAQYEKGPYGTVYYLNPAKVVEQSGSRSRSFKKAFKLTERDRIIMIALHEVIHGMGYSWHDERYANKLTELAATVMKNRKKFNSCF